jgi:hypothetical protein
MSLSYRNITQNVIDGIDFVMYILPNRDFPRNILVGSIHRPYEVWNCDDILMRYKAMLYEDCYINAYPNYQWNIETGRLPPTFTPPPNYLMIDIDRASFRSEEGFQQAVAATIHNVNANITGITGKYPIVIDSGNGYHIHIPMPGLTTSFENMPEFEAFWQQDLDLDNKFLRFLERKLSIGKSDQHHNPSVKSCMFRVPGTINTSAKSRGRKDPFVRVLSGYDHVEALIIEQSSLPSGMRKEYASRPITKLLNDFYAFLVQEQIDNAVDESDRRIRSMFQSLQPSNNFGSNNTIAWIEKILQIGVDDQRKDLLFWVLAPYLITIRRLDYERAYTLLEQWLDMCDDVRRLYPDRSDFRSRVKHCLEYCIDALDTPKARHPIRFRTFKEYYPDLYRDLFFDGSGATEHKS